jgi:two-component system, NtrC family, nitrogen regulation response regulator NtrX
MKRILVVDDKEEVRMVYMLLFSDDEIDIVEAEDGLAALDIVKTESIDLVLSDCKMPRMSGIELMSEVQKIKPELPFIFVSANVREENLGQLVPFSVIPKPFNLGDLKITVQRALNET